MIDSQLLDAYVAELEALRVHGRDLARAYPGIAARLDIGPSRSRDPHVERVVESAAFLAARLRRMIEAGAAELPMAALSILAPALVEPIPSMALLELRGGREPQDVPRGTRFDYELGGRAPVCFSTTMALTVAPLALRLRRMEPSGGSPDGIGIRIGGRPPARLVLCLGGNEPSAAVLMDALDQALAAVELVLPGREEPVPVPKSRLRVHGFAPDEAALPVRPAVHRAHRVVTEFMVFPEKFRFISLTGLPLVSGSEIRLRFSRPLRLPSPLAPDLVTVNRVPGVNLWRSAATPFDVDGSRIEYPVRVDSPRYRTDSPRRRAVECHSIESVDLHGSGGGGAIRLDPIVGLGEVRGTAVRWGGRRVLSRPVGEMLMYFQGLDYRDLGHRRLLAAPTVMASNRDAAQCVQVGAELRPLDGLGGWTGVLAGAPTPYRSAIVESRAMEMLIGFLRSSMSALAGESRRGLLREYLKRFPGAEEADWIDGIGSVTLRATASVRGGLPHPGLAMAIAFDGEGHRTTSQAMVKRVLGELFESQRGINSVEKVVVQST